MLSTSEGILLSRKKFGENSYICNVYTKEAGKQSYLIKGSNAKKSKSRAFYLHPLQPLEFEIYLKEGKKLINVKNLSPHIIYKDIPYNIYKSSTASFLAELINKIIVEEAPNPDLYEYLLNSFIFLDSTDKTAANFHLFFILHFSLSRWTSQDHPLGIEPNIK